MISFAIALSSVAPLLFPLEYADAAVSKYPDYLKRAVITTALKHGEYQTDPLSVDEYSLNTEISAVMIFDPL